MAGRTLSPCRNCKAIASASSGAPPRARTASTAATRSTGWVGKTGLPVAAAGSDVVIITDYNPRTEDPDEIRRVLVESVKANYPDRELHEIADASIGLRKAVSLAGADDTILIAGPGHESYTEVAGSKIQYSARDEARAALREAGW